MFNIEKREYWVSKATSENTTRSCHVELVSEVPKKMQQNQNPASPIAS